MTLIITATMAAAAVYFLASLVCFAHDSIATRRHAPQKAIAEPVSVEEPAPTPEPIEVVAPTEPAPVAPKVAAPALPSSIRGLRQYIRDNSLQESVKAQLGKSVSKATKGELLGVLAVIA